MFFFFKQKTAYEMRISDWSSDVCSSDLLQPVADDAWIEHQLFELRIGKARDLLCIEIGERLAITVALVEDCQPRQPSLRAFEDQELEQHAVVVLRFSPFFVVIADICRCGQAPGAPGFEGHDGVDVSGGPPSSPLAPRIASA